MRQYYKVISQKSGSQMALEQPAKLSLGYECVCEYLFKIIIHVSKNIPTLKKFS